MTDRANREGAAEYQDPKVGLNEQQAALVQSLQESVSISNGYSGGRSIEQMFIAATNAQAQIKDALKAGVRIETIVSVLETAQVRQREIPSRYHLH